MDETTDDVIVESTDTTSTDATSGASGTPDTSQASGTTQTSETPAKTTLDVIGDAITEASAPRRITPKADEAALADTRPRNADGTFKTETPEEKTAREKADADAIALKNETPEQKAERERLAAEAAKKVDHVNDPIPKELKQATQDRIRSLIDTVKAQEILVGQHTALFDSIRDTGASPNEFASMVNYMKLVHSTDPVQLRSAYTMLQAELKGIAVKLGEPLYEVNLLRDPTNKDLVDEIQAGKITSQRAHELALAREQKKTGEAARTATTASEAAAAETQEGIDAMNALQTELTTRDGPALFKAKYDILVPQFQGVIRETGLKPSKWKATFMAAYDALKITMPTAAAPLIPAAGAKPTPLRPKSPAGGGNMAAAPKSALEAINAALEQ